MEEYQKSIDRKPHANNDILLTSKDPHLSHLYGDDPKTPNNEGLANSVLDVDNSFHDETKEPEYRLFEEQGGSYVPDFSPSQHLLLLSRENDLSATRQSPKHGIHKLLSKPGKSVFDHQRDKTLAAAYPRKLKKFSEDHNNNLNTKVTSEAITDQEGLLRSTSVITSTGQPTIPQSVNMSTAAHAQFNHNTGAFFNPESTQYNMDLLAHSAQLLLQTNDNQEESAQNNQGGIVGTDSSDVLRQFAMRAQLRQQQDNQNTIPPHSALTRTTSYSSSGHLQKALSCDSKMKEDSQFRNRQQRHQLQESKSDAAISNIEDAPLLKDLLTHTTNSNQSSNLNLMPDQMHSNVTFELGGESTNQEPAENIGQHAFIVSQSQKMQITQPPYYRDIQQQHYQQFQNNQHMFQNTQINQPHQQILPQQYQNNTTPLQSPNFNPPEPQNYSQSDPNLTPTTPHQPTMQNTFFPGVMHVQNDNMTQDDGSHSAFNTLIAAAGEKLVDENDHPMSVQDIIDEATQSSNDESNNQLYMATIDENPQPQFQYQQQQAVTQNTLSYQPDIKQEPESPMMLKSPHQGNAFFGGHNSGYQPGPPLQSPIAMQRTTSNPNLQAGTPTCEHWQFQHQNNPPHFTTASPSPGIMSPNQPKMQMNRTRRSSGGRKNADGTLSCSLCGHSFRSVPALNGHMRVHSTSSNDKKAKEDPHRTRKLSSGTRDIMNCSSATGTMSLPTKTISMPSHPYPQMQYFSVPRHTHPSGLISMPGVPNAAIKTEPATYPIRSMEYSAYPVTSVGVVGHPVIIGHNGQRYPQQMIIPTNMTNAVRIPSFFKTEELPHNLHLVPHHDHGVGNLPPNSNHYPPTIEYSEAHVFNHESNFHQLNPALYLENQNRSTPLADFAEIVVAHDSMNKNEFQSSAPPDSDSENSKIDQTQNSGDVNVLMESVSKDQLLNPSINSEDMSKFGRHNQQNASNGDPFILPASIPVNNEYHSQMNAASLEIGLHEHMLAVDPSKILPNSMMGGNPGSNFKAIRQRHHSEGSMLKTIIPTNIPSIESLIDAQPYTNSIKANNESVKLKTSRKRTMDNPLNDIKSSKVPKTVTLQIESKTTVTKVKAPEEIKEVWTVPKSIPAPKTRHRRHSADSRLTSRPFKMSYYPKSFGSSQTNPRRKRKPPPLIIPPSVNTFHNNNMLYQSQLHRIRRVSGESANSNVSDKIPPYTPPPMLSPMRSGPGLYRSTPQTPMKLLSRQLSLEPPIPATIDEEDETVRCPEPKINVGFEYQAGLPTLRSRSKVIHDKHKATLVWKPPAKVEKFTKSIEDFMTLSCSAIVPKAGNNKEYAMHLLQAHNGDIVSCLKALLKPDVKSHPHHTMAGYLYTGTTKWLASERALFDKYMLQHRKDFIAISNLIESKSTSECVSYYYHVIKRRKRRIQRPRRYRHESEELQAEEEKNGYDEDYSYSDEGEEVASIGQPVDVREERLPFVQPSLQQKHVQDVIKPNKLVIASYTPSQVDMSFPCKFTGCVQSFPTAQLLCQHQAFHKTQSSLLDRIRASPSPANSPASVASVDAEIPPQMFTCPRCGKSFAKVKSRNAHMKTHGKHAQEKRKQKEEEMRRKEQEATRRKQERMMVNWDPNFMATFQHHQQQNK